MSSAEHRHPILPTFTSCPHTLPHVKLYDHRADGVHCCKACVAVERTPSAHCHFLAVCQSLHVWMTSFFGLLGSSYGLGMSHFGVLWYESHPMV